MVVDPRGEILVDAGEQEAVVTAALDGEMVKKYRSRFPVLQDMRSDFLRLP